MTKYSKVYLRNKKESNISMLQRFNFLKSIFVDGMSVKNASSKWKIHYSTAKIIARNAKKQKEVQFFQSLEYQSPPTKQCEWRQVKISQNFHNSSQKCRIYDDDSNSEYTTGNIISPSKLKIEIVSTIGWTYKEEGSENICK